jgi:hypothetical protein
MPRTPTAYHPAVVGDCGLCQKMGVELLDSHYVPRSLYKLIRDPRFQNPHPVLIAGGASRISSRQASDYFLCADCEDRFSKRCESWVLANCWRDEKTFKLRDALLESKPLAGSTADTKIYLGEQIPGVEPDKLAYFGASIFWRGAARAWQIDQVRVPRLPFSRYEELFRLFLLDKGPWPEKAVMYIFVGAGMESMRNNIVLIPAKISTNGSYIYRFRIPGITYLLLLGERFKKYRSMCTYHAKGRPIYIMDANDQWNFKDAMHEYADSPRVGVLKDRLEGPDATPLNWPDEVLRRLLPPHRKK